MTCQACAKVMLIFSMATRERHRYTPIEPLRWEACKAKEQAVLRCFESCQIWPLANRLDLGIHGL